MSKLLGSILEGLAEVGKNSWTAEEKETLLKARELCRAHGYTDAADELDEVIKKFVYGFEKRPTKTTTPIDTRPITPHRSSLTPAEWAYKLKIKLPKSIDILDFKYAYTDSRVIIKLVSISRTIAQFEIEDGHYMGGTLHNTLYRSEYCKAESKIMAALEELR